MAIKATSGRLGVFFMELSPSKELYGPSEVAVSLPGLSHVLSTLLRLPGTLGLACGRARPASRPPEERMWCYIAWCGHSSATCAGEPKEGGLALWGVGSNMWESLVWIGRREEVGGGGFTRNSNPLLRVRGHLGGVKGGGRRWSGSKGRALLGLWGVGRNMWESLVRIGQREVVGAGGFTRISDPLQVRDHLGGGQGVWSGGCLATSAFALMLSEYQRKPLWDDNHLLAGMPIPLILSEYHRKPLWDDTHRLAGMPIPLILSAYHRSTSGSTSGSTTWATRTAPQCAHMKQRTRRSRVGCFMWAHVVPHVAHCEGCWPMRSRYSPQSVTRSSSKNGPQTAGLGGSPSVIQARSPMHWS